MSAIAKEPKPLSAGDRAMNRSDIKDPMLQAAAEGIASDDHLRWLIYADIELARLRDVCGLPTPTGYSVGKPNYAVGTSPKAKAMRAEVERRCKGTLSPNGRVAVEQVLDEILADAALDEEQKR